MFNGEGGIREHHRRQRDAGGNRKKNPWVIIFAAGTGCSISAPEKKGLGSIRRFAPPSKSLVSESILSIRASGIIVASV